MISVRTITIYLAIGLASCKPVAKTGASDSQLRKAALDLDVADSFRLDADFCPQASGPNLKNMVLLSSVAFASYASQFRLGPYAERLGFRAPAAVKEASRASLIIGAITDYHEMKEGQATEAQQLGMISIWEYLLRMSRRGDNLQQTLIDLYDGDQQAAKQGLENAYRHWIQYDNISDQNADFKRESAPQELKSLMYNLESTLHDKVTSYWSKISKGNIIALFAGWIAPLEQGQCSYLRADNQVSWFENDDAIIVAFRGTEPESQGEDLQTDLAAVQAPVDSSNGVFVHTGFLCASDDIWQNFLKIRMANVAASSPRKPVFLTGHSLGGALATVIGYQILTTGATSGLNLKGIYTYGSPRVGTIGFKERLEAAAKAKGTAIVRVRNGNDTISLLPADLQWAFERPYQHVGTLVHLRDDVFGSYDFSSEAQSGIFANTYRSGKTAEQPVIGVYQGSGRKDESANSWVRNLGNGDDVEHTIGHGGRQLFDALRAAVGGLSSHSFQYYQGRLQWTLDAWREKNQQSPQEECKSLTQSLDYFPPDVVER